MNVIIKRQSDGQLHLVVSGDFGFEAARELLFLGKECWAKMNGRALTVELEGVQALSSSAVGVLVLLKEMVGGGGFTIRLTRCADTVQQLFDSGVLDRYFDGAIGASAVASSAFLPHPPLAPSTPVRA